MLIGFDPRVQAQEVDFFESFTGNVQYVITGGSLRTAPNAGPGADACAVTTIDTAALAGIPAGSTIQRAYLYWVGSGATADNNITLNGSNFTASRTFANTFVFGGTDFDFFSGFTDVTSVVAPQGNGNYTFSNLTVNNGAPHCPVQAVISGWALFVVYENDATERQRVINLFDGFEFFRDSSVNFTLANFSVTPAPDGRVSIVTWDGDAENSGPGPSGLTEQLEFNNTPLTDALNPLGNQFNSTVNTLNDTMSYGVDIDTYDVAALINENDTTAGSDYSSGADLVLLSLEVGSFAAIPQLDHTIDKSHTGDFKVFENNDYEIVVSNLSPFNQDPGTITVTDTLPTGLSYDSFGGTDWNCNAVNQDVTCTHPGPLATSSSLPTLTLTVFADEDAFPSVTNTASVSSTSANDTVDTNNDDTDQADVVGGNLSTSTKTVVDLNGGDVEPGDTLRFTIALNESVDAATTNVQVSDDISALLSNFSVITIPPGSTDNSTGAGTGANGAGFLDITDIAVDAGATVTVVFEAEVVSGANAGDLITNTATIANPFGAGASPAITPVTVLAFSTPTTGNKLLYFYDLATADPNGFNVGPQPYLSRTPPVAAGNVTVDTNNPPRVWTLTPTLQKEIDVLAGTIPVTLYLSKGGAGGGPVARSALVTLSSVGTSNTIIGSATLDFAAPPRITPAAFTFNIPVANNVTLVPGSQLTLTVENTTPGGNNRRIRVFPLTNGDFSTISLDITPVIEVDSITYFDAAFPGGTARTSYSPGATLYVRSIVSDPFGSFDINPTTQPQITISDSSGNMLVSAQSMTEVADSNADTKTFEYAYTIPALGPEGYWDTQVTAFEGTEGTVNDMGVNSFMVATATPDLLMSKFVQVLSDPFNGNANPKSIPGAIVQYTLLISNQGEGEVDNNTLVLSDALPPNTEIFVDSSSTDPVVFIDGSPATGLNYTYATDAAFTNQAGGGAPFNYSPVPDADGFDSEVTGIQISPTGALPGNSNFSVRFRIRID